MKCDCKCHEAITSCERCDDKDHAVAKCLQDKRYPWWKWDIYFEDENDY